MEGTVYAVAIGATDTVETEAPVTDSEHNHGFGTPQPQGHGGQPNQNRKDTHPETVDFESPLSQERQYSNPFATPADQQPTQHFSAPQAQPGQPSQQGQQGQQGWTEHQGQHGQWGNQQQPAGGYNAAYPQQAAASTGSSNGGKLILIAVLILAMLLVIAALAYLFFFKNSTTGNQAQPPLTTEAQVSEETTGADEEATSAAETTTSEEETTSAEPEKRPEHPALPDGAQPVNDAARNNEPGGDFNNVYRGSAVTSEPFANIVRDEYVKHYVDTKELNATINAYSPITKQTYTVDCSDNGKFVTCKGGNNAIVYIV
ncbi:putative secreted protein [Corynebacterium minutissimum]|uniref:Putative secreted protein n=1 Tax=Corynebacterium minutissimum TaxID=38301 RepID=A0A376CVX7_9CORY|nr:putative secreted protein [Corynebacterium minutissimum]